MSQDGHWAHVCFSCLMAKSASTSTSALSTLRYTHVVAFQPCARESGGSSSSFAEFLAMYLFTIIDQAWSASAAADCPFRYWIMPFGMLAVIIYISLLVMLHGDTCFSTIGCIFVSPPLILFSKFQDLSDDNFLDFKNKGSEGLQRKLHH